MVSFSIAILQTQLLSPLSRPQLVLSCKLVPSQRADTIAAGKGDFLQMMTPHASGRVLLVRESAGGEVICVNLAPDSGWKSADQAALFPLDRCSPKLKFVPQQQQPMLAAVRVVTFQALSLDCRNMLPQRS